MAEKSETCIGRVSGEPLSVYHSKEEAQNNADYANSTYENSKLVPYKCKKCRKWHLAPQSRQTPSSKCSYCTGADGKPKDLYKTYADAKRRADIIRSERGLHLEVYECEHTGGWHLTKDSSY